MDALPSLAMLDAQAVSDEERAAAKAFMETNADLWGSSHCGPLFSVT